MSFFGNSGRSGKITESDLPVTVKEKLVKVNEIGNLSELQTKNKSSLTAATNEVTTQLADKAVKTETVKAVPLSRFLIITEATHTQAFKRAVDFCRTNNRSLYVEDGNYIIDETIVLNFLDFGVECQSNNTVFKVKHEGYAFEIAADRTKFIGGRFIPFDESFKNKFNGLHVTSSLCLVDSVTILEANEAFKFSTSSWCSVALNMNISGVNKGVIFGAGSGGCEFNIMFLDGSAGYENTIENGSVAITFEPEINSSHAAGYSSVTGDGQISSFHYVMDVQGKLEKIKLGELYIEHCLLFYTPESKGIVDLSRCHIALTGGSHLTSVSQVTNITLNGINKSDRYIDAKDSAIPYNNLLGYFLFNQSDLWKDEIGQTTFYLPERLEQSVKSTNLWGNTSEIKSKIDWNPPLIVPPSKPKEISFVVSLRRNENTGIIDLTRLLQIGIPGINEKILITIGEAFGIVNQLDNSKQIQISSNIIDRDFNNCIGICIDIPNNKTYGYSPSLPPVVLSTDLSSLSNVDYDIEFMSSGQNAVGLAFNYLALFEGILTFEEFLNIYRSTRPLVKNFNT